MLLQRLRTADPLAEAAILHNLVPLAVSGPKSSFVDVIRTFTQVSRTATDEGSRGAEIVQAAQLKLARAPGAVKEDGVEKDEAHEDDDLANKGRKEILPLRAPQCVYRQGSRSSGCCQLHQG
ncbi:hypothetical protein CF319_g8622 [Tilletia indica]|nr:hypothetical protein CF319_g8622 [Tilletia indica]